MPANTRFVLPESGEISFSQIRDMYDQGNGDTNGFKNYYRDGSFVGPSTYHTDYDPLTNTAKNISDSGDLKMSQFRGAYKEHTVTLTNVQAPYSLNTNGGIDTNEKRTYRFRITGNIYHKSNSDSWDVNGNGKTGIIVDVPDSNTRVIIHVTSAGKIGGGPGRGGTGGAGGAGGVSGLPGLGSTTQGVSGGDADCTTSTSGQDGENGTSGSRGGDCITITDYPANETLYIQNDGNFHPGGGGGGGAGGGSGGGAGRSGGGGGKGAQGYNDITQTRYEQNVYHWRTEEERFGGGGGGTRYKLELRWNGVIIYSSTKFNTSDYDLTSYNGYIRGNRKSFSTYISYYEITEPTVLQYFDGGNGSDGARGTNGSSGYNGADGSMGRTLGSDGGSIPTDISGHSAKADKPNTFGSSAGSGDTGATGTCNAGNGGDGGWGGAGGQGGGYSAGGAGGGFGAAGSSGGTGRRGFDGYLQRDAIAGASNSCGGGDRSSGGASCSETDGGDNGGAGGAGGAAGTNLYNMISAVVSANI
jgi:hypothetical protein